MKQNDAPTMKDVAREAGVSLGTVSKVVNGIPVGEYYRKRVEAATEKLGYQVNSYARGLKTNKTNCIALVMPSLRHSFFAMLTNELTNALMSCYSLHCEVHAVLSGILILRRNVLRHCLSFYKISILFE